MIETVTKNYIDGEFENYTMVKDEVSSFVPLDPDNTDYQAIQEWIADGGTVIDNGGGE